MAKRQVTGLREKGCNYVDPFSFESNDKLVDYMIEKINTERIDNE